MQTSLFKKIVFEILFTLGFLLLLFVVYLFWERSRDPLNAINHIDSDVRLAHSQTIFDSSLAGKRYYKDILLFSQKTDTIKAIISFPDDIIRKKLPVITILGGLRIARANFSYIKDPGQNIIVIFVYPYQAEQWDNGFILTEIPRVRKSILKTPGQIVELIHWIQKQTWADSTRMSLLGYSFGALFLPAVTQVAVANNIKTGPTILSYGGVDFNYLLKKNLNVKPKWLRGPLAWISSSMIDVVDPLHYAAKMKGNIYLINGLHDKQIPRASWERLHQMIPPSAKIDILDEGHMHPRKPELTQKLVDMSRAWLKEQGILN